jgi:hypothetical protein
MSSNEQHGLMKESPTIGRLDCSDAAWPSVILMWGWNAGFQALGQAG